MEVATMVTKLHGHLDALDEARTFLTPSRQRIGIRRYIASKANVDFQDVIKLEYHGLNGCDPQTANKIFQALADVQGKLVDDHEKYRLLSKTDEENYRFNRRIRDELDYARRIGGYR
jgi:hypothetical protein